MRFRIDFMSLPLHIRKARFRQFQLLAFSKGIIWGSGRHIPYTIKRLDEFGKSMAGIKEGFGRRAYNMFSMTDKDIPIIDIKEALKQLKEYKPSETTKVDQGTVQSFNASTATTSYTIPTGFSSIVRATTGYDWGI
jgi:hypothetical protein